MTIEQNLRAELIGDAGVAAIVGSRVHPELRPQDGALPAIVYTALGYEREMDMAGPAPMVRVRFQIDCWHTTVSGVLALEAAVDAALNGVGIASPHLLGAQLVQLVEKTDRQALSQFDGDKLERRIVTDWTILYLEA